MGGDLAMSGAEETGSGLLRKAGKPSVFFFFLSLPSWALFTTIGFVRPKGEEEAFKYGPESGKALAQQREQSPIQNQPIRLLLHKLKLQRNRRLRRWRAGRQRWRAALGGRRILGSRSSLP